MVGVFILKITIMPKYNNIETNKSRVTSEDSAMSALNKFASHYTAISTVFIFEALDYYAATIVSDKDRVKEELEPSDKIAFINPNLWIEIAEEWINCEKTRKNKT